MIPLCRPNFLCLTTLSAAVLPETAWFVAIASNLALFCEVVALRFPSVNRLLSIEVDRSLLTVNTPAIAGFEQPVSCAEKSRVYAFWPCLLGEIGIACCNHVIQEAYTPFIFNKNESDTLAFTVNCKNTGWSILFTVCHALIKLHLVMISDKIEC
jgi:hypothetical protein